MVVLIVPEVDLSFPTLGPALADFIEERFVFGPGSLAGQPAKLDPEKRAALYRLYEVYPKGHRLGGRRRFQRGALEWRKGLAKTEFAAWVCGLELHPEAPVRFDHWEDDEPAGRPVAYPYIPMMATTEEQVSELAYGVLKYVLEESPDADLFDISLERIIRLNEQGRADGSAVPVSNSPGSRDGALTTFQHFDEPHRLFLPRQLHAHETMAANLTKRPLEDPWAFYTSTAGEPGQNSIQEQVRGEAEKIAKGEIEDPALFFFARWAGDEHKELMPRAATKTEPEVTPAQALANRIAAIAEATGPAGEYGPGQFESIAKNWDRPKADTAYLERVWLNRWRKSNARMFDAIRIDELAAAANGRTIADGTFITLGFDGARYRDSTAIVATDIESGMQQLLALWERPENVDDWEVPESEVTDAMADAFRRFDVWKLYGDPPHWTETMGSWAGRWPDQVEEWWMNNRKRAAYAAREYAEAMASRSVTFGGVDDLGRDFLAHSDFVRHLKNVGTKDTRLLDDEGQPLLIMAKPDGRIDEKIDAGAAGNLSWKARLDALAAGAKPRKKPRNRIRRIR